MAKQLTPRIAPAQQTRFSAPLQRQAFGSTEAQSIQQAGDVLSKFGNSLEKQYIQNEENKGVDAAVNAQVAGDAQIRRIMLENPTQALDKSNEALEKAKREGSKDLQSEYSQRVFKDSFDRYANRTRLNAIATQERAINNQTIEVNEKAINQGYQNIIKDPNWLESASNLQEIQNANDRILRARGIEEGSELWNRSIEEHNQRILMSRITGFAQNGNLAGAQVLLDKEGERLNPEQQGKMQQFIGQKAFDNQVNQMGNQAALLWDQPEEYLKMTDDVRNDPNLSTQQKESLVNILDGRRAEGRKIALEMYAQRKNEAIDKYIADGNVSHLNTLKTPAERSNAISLRASLSKNQNTVDESSPASQQAYGVTLTKIQDIDFGNDDWTAKVDAVIAENEKNLSPAQIKSLRKEGYEQGFGQKDKTSAPFARSSYKTWIKGGKSLTADDEKSVKFGMWAARIADLGLHQKGIDEQKKALSELASIFNSSDFEVSETGAIDDTDFGNFIESDTQFPFEDIEMDQEVVTGTGITKAQVRNNIVQARRRANSPERNKPITDREMAANTLILMGFSLSSIQDYLDSAYGE